MFVALWQRKRTVLQAKRVHYIVRVPTEQARAQQLVERGGIDALTDLPLIKKTVGGVQVWHGSKVTEYYTRGDEVWQATGKTARRVEDRFALRQIMAELGEAEIVWE